MLDALGEAVYSELVVGLVECAIDGKVICVLNDAHSLFLLILHEVGFIDTLGTTELSAVVGDMR